MYQNMPTYKLTYINVTSKTFGMGFEEWPALKRKIPMILEGRRQGLPPDEGHQPIFGQTVRALRVQTMEIDMCVDDVQDLREFYTVYICEDEPIRKAELLKIANEKALWFLAKFEDRVKKNGGYFVGGKTSWADFHFSGVSGALSNIAHKDFIKNYPALQKINENVRSHPKVKAYRDKRPKTML